MGDMYELGLFIKDVGNFNMRTFEGRLKFQKTVQLLQSFGIDMGYKFGWYLRGPYCPTLTKDGFELAAVVQTMPNIPVKFADEEDQEAYEKFKEFMKDKKDDPDTLEIASSICFLRNENYLDEPTTMRLTANKMSRFTMEQCKKIRDELKKCGVIS